MQTLSIYRKITFILGEYQHIAHKRKLSCFRVTNQTLLKQEQPLLGLFFTQYLNQLFPIF